MDSGIPGTSDGDLRRRIAELEARVEALSQANEALRQEHAATGHLGEALRSAGALLAKSQAIAHVGSWVNDLVSGRLVWSDEVFRIFGLEPQEFGATYAAFLEAVHPDDRAAVDEAYTRSIAAGADAYDIEHRVIRPHTGEIRVVHERCEHEVDEAGAVVRSVGMVQDITERKHGEAERQRLKDELLQAQKAESVGRLAGGVAHDFNNMLSVILGHAEMGLSQAAPDDPLREDLAAIEKAARHSADLVRQLLAYARRQTVAPRVIDIGEAVDGMFAMLRRLIRESITLDWTSGRRLWPVRIDPAQVSQVLVSLCLNARDAIAGVGTIRVETANVVVGPGHPAIRRGCQPGEYVALRVSDNGSGMEPEVIEHLFEPFYTTKEVGQGSGLGMPAVQGIVSQNGGAIDVESRPGAGTTVTILLPRHVEATVAAASEASPTVAGRTTVLLVEDEPAILKVAARMLQARGHVVLSAPGPMDAIEVAGRHQGPIDLLITDVVMPGMNGRELAARLQAARPGLKCLFMSGYTANVIADHGVLDEGVHFIEKPFSAATLAAKAREALGKA